jgi:nicotinamidase-related amidase
MTSPLDQAERDLEKAMQAVVEYYAARGIFHDLFGFGQSPAIVVVDFAYGWTDDAYAGGSRALDGPVQETARLLASARPRGIPVIFTTSPYRPGTGDQPFKSAADRSQGHRAWDERACRIDQRVAPRAEDLVIHKENASAFFGTHLAPYLIQHGIDTLLITGCSTSACILGTAIDAKSYRFRPAIVRECVGDRSPWSHVWTLFEVQARFADVVSVEEALAYVEGKDEVGRAGQR